MTTPKRDRVFVRSTDGKPTIVSAQSGNFAARLCKKHRVRTLAQAKEVGLFPAFVDLAALESEVGRVLRTNSFDREAEQRVDDEIAAAVRAGRTGPIRTERYRQGRVGEEAKQLRVADLVQVIEPGLNPVARRQIAGRAIKLSVKPAVIIKMELAYDLDVYTDLEFSGDVTMGEFGDVRIFMGARIVARASHFILRTASLEGNLLDMEALPSDVSLRDLVTSRA